MNFDLITPLTTRELLGTMRKLQKQPFRFIAGGTDLLMELRKHPVESLTVINLAQLKDNAFKSIRTTANSLRLGAGVTAHAIAHHRDIAERFPVLTSAAFNLASTQIRQVATVGGNLCTASPSGDIACALVALEAECTLMNTSGKTRSISIKEFFTGPRQTAMRKNEFLYCITISSQKSKHTNLHSGFIKIGTRKAMECSVVSLAYHILMDEKGIIKHSGFAIGASAPVIRFTANASQFLFGKQLNKLSPSDREKFAELVTSYASPITDIRATAWYRKQVLHNISRGILE